MAGLKTPIPRAGEPGTIRSVRWGCGLCAATRAPEHDTARDGAAAQQLVHRPAGEHRLIVAVGPGVIVRPRDARSVLVVAHRGRIDGLIVELVDRPERSEPDQAAAQVLVVTGGENPSAVLAEPHDGVGVGGTESIPDVDGHQPELIEVQLVEAAQNRIVTATLIAVARGHLMAGGPQLVGE